jgi:2-polyprenyl-3-methyl-5-hydroxy-6-metoxy-1,4-benzoquinol methylase
MASQEIFDSCYRNRQKPIHHMAYMRMCKVLLALKMLRRAKVNLESADIFDYGFGAGTFYRYCPQSAALHGVEVDKENVRAVAEMLRERGYLKVDLQALDVASWADHPLFERQYDVILCSHVLEHLEDPVSLLRKFTTSLKPGGVIVALLPINERVLNPHHVAPVDRNTIQRWAGAADLQVADYLEDDPWIYWLQPLYATESRWQHKVAQAVSLGLGLPATACGEQLWGAASRVFGLATASKPTQAGVILRR